MTFKSKIKMQKSKTQIKIQKFDSHLSKVGYLKRFEFCIVILIFDF